MKNKITLILLIMTTIFSNQQTNAQVKNADVPVPISVTIDASLSKTEADKIMHAGLMFYAFWNTGKEQYLHEGVADNFFDNTLPNGRPQGLKGLLFASNNFRKAVPDLQCSVEDFIITKDKITCRQIYTGHNTGAFGDHPATNKPVKFFAIDILHVRDGKVFEDWHLEDNLTFLQQIGVVK
jgi:predicted ester cyclase